MTIWYETSRETIRMAGVLSQGGRLEFWRSFETISYEVWRQHAAFNQHSISPRAGTDTGFREALFRKRSRQPGI